MPAIVTDQFRINNTNNFISSVEDTSNSYYIFLGLPNPRSDSFGRDDDWQTENEELGSFVPNPPDNDSYISHYKDTALFGRRVTSSNIRRAVRRVDWERGKKYDLYRHDYSPLNLSPVTKRSRLYDSNYYVITSEFKVYICLDNGSSGENITGNASLDEPSFTDLEPSKAGESGDGYVWKYLFTINPSDIIKFDSTEYLTLPNSWSTSTEPQILSVRENGDSSQNNNQIKKIYIENAGSGYSSGEVNILGDGTGGKAFIEVDSSGSIISATVTLGGSGYTYGIVDLGSLQPSGNIPNPPILIPIIPPALGHGYDIYKELGGDRVLLYARFDDSTKDFPTNTKFSQIGILKNPEKFTSTDLYTENQFSNLYSLKFSAVNDFLPVIGEKISQTLSSDLVAVGYVASYDSNTQVLKYFKDRSLYFGDGKTYTDYSAVSTKGNANVEFDSTGGSVTGEGGFEGTIDGDFNGISSIVNDQVINLGSQFTNGISTPEINNNTGEIIYIDNRPLVGRNSRQKEDVKIILEF